ncbi:hypothetical protein A4A49_42714, partial [Nicotiana attenuata]
WPVAISAISTVDNGQGQMGKEIVLINANVQQPQLSSDIQQSNGAKSKEIVPVNGKDQQGNGETKGEVEAEGVIVTNNMFAALEGQDGVGSTTIREKEVQHKDEENAKVKDVQKESTAAWVSKTFMKNVVAINQSCQEIPSQATEIDAALHLANNERRLNLDGRSVWSQQVEEDPEENELSEGACGEEESSDEEKDQEEHSVNNKGMGQQQKEKEIGDEKNTDQGDRSHIEESGEQKSLSPKNNKEVPPAPNIPVEKQDGGTDLREENGEKQKLGYIWKLDLRSFHTLFNHFRMQIQEMQLQLIN